MKPLFTVRLTVTVCFRLPEVPVMVIVAVPVLARMFAFSVSMLLLVVLAGLNEAVTPLGSPVAARLTLPVKPLCGVTVIEVVTLEPRFTATLAGDADSV